MNMNRLFVENLTGFYTFDLAGQTKNVSFLRKFTTSTGPGEEDLAANAVNARSRGPLRVYLVGRQDEAKNIIQSSRQNQNFSASERSDKYIHFEIANILKELSRVAEAVAIEFNGYVIPAVWRGLLAWKDSC